ncbi:MAG: sugar-binding protein [Anaerolineae bacterium]|nr:sugar-binding protein [Anaerolineae bacterium]
MHFEDGLTQTEIATRTGYSPSMISRLLLEARKQGIIEVRIHHPHRRRTDMERELEELLNLKAVRVMVHSIHGYPQRLRHLGNLAARLVEELVHNNMTIGVTWGPAVYETINAMRPGTVFGVHVVQMTGSIQSLSTQMDGQELARNLARALIGYYTPLPAPAVVDSEATRDALIRDPHIQKVLEQFANIELALLELDSLDPEHSSLLQAGYLTVEQLEELEQNGAVGDVCARGFDLYGNLLDIPLTRRVIGITAEELTVIPLKLAIAGGHAVILPIIGAARAELINMLVTDEEAATGVLQILKRMGMR